jgi:hypothetical protein
MNFANFSVTKQLSPYNSWTGASTRSTPGLRTRPTKKFKGNFIRKKPPIEAYAFKDFYNKSLYEQDYLQWVKKEDWI